MLDAEHTLEKDVEVDEHSSSSNLRVGMDGGRLEDARTALESLERPGRGGLFMLRSASLGLLDHRDKPGEEALFEGDEYSSCSRVCRLRGDGSARLDEYGRLSLLGRLLREADLARRGVLLVDMAFASLTASALSETMQKLWGLFSRRLVMCM